jgi:hypothetical protein
VGAVQCSLGLQLAATVLLHLWVQDVSRQRNPFASLAFVCSVLQSTNVGTITPEPGPELPTSNPEISLKYVKGSRSIITPEPERVS